MNPLEDLRDRLEDAYEKSKSGYFTEKKIGKLLVESNNAIKKIIERNKEIQIDFE